MINRLVFENLRHRKLRTCLTALSIGFQVTMILTIVGLSRGMLQDSANRARGVGADIWIKSPDASIVNVGSSLGSMVMPGTMLYGSTKASLEYLTRAWAYQLAADRIRVNCVAPGVIDTPIHATYSDDLTATYADLARRVPMGRMGTPEEVAEWIWIVISPSTSWSTGNVIHVDGGHVLGIPETAGG